MSYLFDKVKNANLLSKPVKAGANVKKNEIQAIDAATGLLVPFNAAVEIATPGTYGQIHIAVDALDNTLGADGYIGYTESERYVNVYAPGTIGVVTMDAVAQTDIGADVYAGWPGSFSKVALGVKVGKIVNYISATQAEIMLY